MSRSPDKDSVDELRRLILKSVELRDHIERARQAASVLALLEEEFNSIRRKIAKQVEGMDCHSSGNAGWEGRMEWMLAELLRPWPKM